MIDVEEMIPRSNAEGGEASYYIYVLVLIVRCCGLGGGLDEIQKAGWVLTGRCTCQF